MAYKPALLLMGKIAPRLLGDALDDKFDVIRLGDGALDATLAERVVAALTNTLDASWLDRLPNLRLIATPGTGYDGIDVKAARARGVRIVNAGSTHSGDVADHAVALTLAAVHRLPEMQAWVRDGGWTERASPKPRRSMSAQRFGIVGLGAIGSAVAERLAPFGGEIAWWGPRPKASRWPRRETLLELARGSTALIVAVRGDAGRLIDAQTIAAVGPEGLIVNISRGAVIDEPALIAALKEGRLGGAALDVFAEEPTSPAAWAAVPNVVLTPHVAGVSHESIAKLREAAVRNLSSVLDGGPVVNEVVG